MLRIIVAAALICAAAPSGAEEIYVPVPTECLEIARQHGIPTILTSRRDIARAIAILARLDRNAPNVSECRAAVRQLLSHR